MQTFLLLLVVFGLLIPSGISVIFQQCVTFPYSGQGIVDAGALQLSRSGCNQFDREAAEGILEVIDGFLAMEKATIDGTSPGDLEKYKQQAKPLSPINDTLRQHHVATDLPDAHAAHDALRKGKAQLLSWLEKVCPGFEESLGRLHMWADSQVLVKIESTDWKTAANMCPGEKLRLPSEIENVVLLHFDVTWLHRPGLQGTKPTDTIL